MVFKQLNPILESLCELWPPFPVLSWHERHPVWSSAAVAHLLQGSTCCAFRDCILHTQVVTSGYLSYCCLSIISNQSAQSPPTSDFNKACSSTQLLLTGYLHIYIHAYTHRVCIYIYINYMILYIYIYNCYFSHDFCFEFERCKVLRSIS